MLKFTSVVGCTSCGPTYIESFLTIFGQCINVLNYIYIYIYIYIYWGIFITGGFVVSLTWTIRIWRLGENALHYK